MLWSCVHPSVCLSVYPSIASRYCIKTAKHIIMQTRPTCKVETLLLKSKDHQYEVILACLKRGNSDDPE